MKPAEITIVRTGSANLASVQSAFERLGACVRFSDSPRDVAEAARVVLPGVGAFGPAMQHLRRVGLDDAIRTRIERGRAFLGICLGMQVLCEGSDESPGETGLGVVRGLVRRFAGPVRVPQMGWNTIRATPGASVLSSGAVYFANSFRLGSIPEGWQGATSDHGGAFVAGLERGAVVACQFHPELSGRSGADLLTRWLAWAEREGGA